MNNDQRNEMLNAISAMFAELINEKPQKEQKVEMITIKEAAEQVSGLSTHTVRQLVLQGKIPSMRTGEGKNGKILIPKAALMEYVTGERGDNNRKEKSSLTFPLH